MNRKQSLLLVSLLFLMASGLGLLLGWFDADPDLDLSGQDAVQTEEVIRDRTAGLAQEPEPVEDASPRVEVESRNAVEDRDASPQDLLLLRGIVLAEKGRPIPQAAISLLRPWRLSYPSLDLEENKPKKPVQTQKTGADGRFQFRVLRGRAFELRVEASGFGRAIVPECYGGQDLDIHLEPIGCTLFGIATWEDTGAPVAEVKLRGFRAGGPELFAGATGGDGGFLFTGVPSGKLSFAATPKIGRQPGWASLTLEPGTRTRHDFKIQRGSTVHGRVTDSITKLPIANAEIGEGWTFSRTVRTDANGRYEAKGWTASGIHAMHVRAEGYGRMGKPVPAASDGRIELDFELSPGGKAKGRILTESGAAITGVYVAAVASELNGMDQKIDWKAARTATDGSFLLSGLRTDVRHVLLVRKSGFATLIYDFPRPVKLGDELDLGTVHLQRPACIEGRVLAAGDTPVAGARVSISGWNSDRERMLTDVDRQLRAKRKQRSLRALPGGHYVSSRSTRTDKKGAFRFADLAAGRWKVQVSDRGSPRVPPVEIELQPGQVHNELVIRMGSGHLVSGHIESWDGKPVRAILSLVPQKGTTGSPLQSLVEKSQRFRFDRVPPGQYKVRALPIPSGDESIPLLLEGEMDIMVPGTTKNLLVVLREAAAIEGTLLDARGKPAPGIIVAAYRDKDGGELLIGRVKTQADGRFRFKLANGTTLTLKAGPPAKMLQGMRQFLALPDPATAVTAQDVQAGTKDVVLKLR